MRTSLHITTIAIALLIGGCETEPNFANRVAREHESGRATVHAGAPAAPTHGSVHGSEQQANKRPCTVAELQEDPERSARIEKNRAERKAGYDAKTEAIREAALIGTATQKPKVKTPTTPPVVASLTLEEPTALHAQEYTNGCFLEENWSGYRTAEEYTENFTNNWPSIIALAAGHVNEVFNRYEHRIPNYDPSSWTNAAFQSYMVGSNILGYVPHAAQRALAHATMDAVDANVQIATPFVGWGIALFRRLTAENEASVAAVLEAHLLAAESAQITDVHFERLTAEALKDGKGMWENSGTPLGSLYRLWLSVLTEHGDRVAGARWLRMRYVLLRAAKAYNLRNVESRAVALRNDIHNAPTGSFTGENERAFLEREITTLAAIPTSVEDPTQPGQWH